MRGFHDLSNEEIQNILFEANKRCYADVADEFDIAYSTVRRVVRMSKKALKRYH